MSTDYGLSNKHTPQIVSAYRLISLHNVIVIYFVGRKLPYQKRNHKIHHHQRVDGWNSIKHNLFMGR